MTVDELYSRVVAGKPTILVDVRDASEYARFNIGGNRMTIAEIERNAAKLGKIKLTHTAVVSCVYFDSKRVPSAVKRLFDLGFNEVFALQGTRYGGGGLLVFSNKYPRVRIPKIILN